VGRFFLYLLSLCVVFCWGIWNEKNKRIFKGGLTRERIFFVCSILCLFQFWTRSSSGIEHVFARDAIMVLDSDSDISMADSDTDLLD
jgi:hypothetical protein